MSDKTAIEWTRGPDGTPGATWNPLRADAPGHKDRWYCERISPGCDNCYASTFNRRLGGSQYPHVGDDPESFARHGISPVHLDQKATLAPMHWKRGRRIFVCSMTDLFGEWVTDDQIVTVFRVMASTPQHTYMVLTKRPGRMLRFMGLRDEEQHWPLGVIPNVWFGTTIESSRFKWRANVLREVPAAVRFISFEPLLDDIGPINLDGIHWCITGGESGTKGRWLVERATPLIGKPMWQEKRENAWCDAHGRAWVPTDAGLGAVRSIRDQCVAAGVAYFHKQWGGPTPKTAGRHIDHRTWDEFPAAREAVLA